MAFNPASGTIAKVQIGGSPIAFKNWKVNSGTDLPSVNNFTGGGYKQYVGGLKGGEFTADGPWDVGNMGSFGVGQTVVFDCYVNASVHVPITVVVAKVEFGTDVEDAARVKVTGQTNGSFSVEFS